MRLTKLNDLQRRIEALQAQKQESLVSAEDRALDEGLDRLTVSEMRRLLHIVRNYRDPRTATLRWDKMTGEELSELHQLILVMEDLSAPTGQEREERERLRYWLDYDYETSGLNDRDVAMHLRISRNMCEQWLKKHPDPAAPEDVNLFSKCKAFLFGSGDPALVDPRE